MVSSFPSTLPHGERQYTLICCSRERIVSIHAPTWERPAIAATYAHQERFNPRSRMGSDLPVARDIPMQLRFNPRSHTGSDDTSLEVGGMSKFQPTLPHGERRIGRWQERHPGCFNPRSHTGSDLDDPEDELSTWKFQPTLPHGERLQGLGYQPVYQSVSTHAPAWGATRGNQ